MRTKFDKKLVRKMGLWCGKLSSYLYLWSKSNTKYFKIMPSYFHVNFLNNTGNLGQYTPINVEFSKSRGRLEMITKKEEKQIKFK